MNLTAKSAELVLHLRKLASDIESGLLTPGEGFFKIDDLEGSGFRQLSAGLLFLIDTPKPVPTDWFDGDTTCPDKPGVYEAEWRGVGRWFNYWDGKSWHWGQESPSRAGKDDPMGEQNRPQRWRGYTGPVE